MADRARFADAWFTARLIENKIEESESDPNRDWKAYADQVNARREAAQRVARELQRAVVKGEKTGAPSDTQQILARRLQAAEKELNTLNQEAGKANLIVSQWHEYAMRRDREFKAEAEADALIESLKQEA